MNASGLSIRNLQFAAGTFAFESLSLDIARGEYFVLTGPNGSGKTLLLKLVAGLYRPLSGDIVLDGTSLLDVPPWHRRIGYVPQDGLLFPHLTVLKNIMFGLSVRGVSRSEAQQKAHAMAEMLGIVPLLTRMPQGLSGGEQQKVSLARALVIDPAILLLDEPTSAIAEAARDNLCHELRSLQQRLGITTLHVSHNSRETELVADRMAVLNAGRLESVSSIASANKI